MARLKLRDWMVLLVIGIIVLALLIGVARNRMEASFRARCANNLKQIGQAILLYANENRGAYPRTRAVIAEVVTPTWGTGASAPDPFGVNGPDPNDVSASLYLLLRTQEISSQVFACPASDSAPWDFGGAPNTALNWSNWSGVQGVRKHLSYSYQNPFFDEAASRYMMSMTRYLGDTMGAELAIAADMNPGSKEVLTVTRSSPINQMHLANSRNHSGDGQNVLYGDGHVEFQTHPFCGINWDNIFARRATLNFPYNPLSTTNPSGSSDIRMAPYDMFDNVLLPAAQ